MPQILKEKIVFNDTLVIQEAEIRTDKTSYSRTRLKRQDGAGVLVYNVDSDTIILTRQFRYAIASKTEEENILEIPAGKVDEGEDPFTTALREAEEEIGYKIRPEKIQKIAACFVSPGYTSELLHLYYAEVTNDDQTDEGGGLESEHEEIEIVELRSDEFQEKVRNMDLLDGKTLLAGWWFINRKASK